MATQAERKAATTSAIRQAGRELFATRGFDGATIDDIAERAGVTKGGVYHHYRSKDEIFVEVLEAVQAELAARVTESASAAGDVVESIRLGVARFLLDCAQPDVRQIVLIDGPAVLGWRRWREIDATHFGTLLRQAICALRGVDALSPRDEAVVHLLLGACTEAALVSSTADDPMECVQALSEGFDLLLQGVHAASPPAAHPSA